MKMLASAAALGFAMMLTGCAKNDASLGAIDNGACAKACATQCTAAEKAACAAKKAECASKAKSNCAAKCASKKSE